MTLNDYIQTGITKTGSLTSLANFLDIAYQNLSAANNGRRGLPTFACVKLAQLIGEDERRVIAASELVTEKNPERRAIWLPFVQGIAAAARTPNARTAKRASEAVIFHLSRLVKTIQLRYRFT